MTSQDASANAHTDGQHGEDVPAKNVAPAPAQDKWITKKSGPSDDASMIRSAEQIRAEDGARQELEQGIAIEKSVAQGRRFASERVMAKPDWSVWNVLSWIAFRDLALLVRSKTRPSSGG